MHFKQRIRKKFFPKRLLVLLLICGESPSSSSFPLHARPNWHECLARSCHSGKRLSLFLERAADHFAEIKSEQLSRFLISNLNVFITRSVVVCCFVARRNFLRPF